MSARRERLPQPPHVHVHRALLDDGIVAPDPVEQFRARVDAVGVRHEEMQQAEFGGAQLQPPAVAVHLVCARVEPQPGDLHRLIAQLRRAPAQHRANARDQLARRKRLGQVIVGAGLERRDLVAFSAARGEKDDRQLARARLGAELAREGEARLPGEHPVEQRRIG
ncbi:MAG: hypothetical protein A2Z64_12120 [Betaproteobacteria bacterium RIFCSPLOWO2_02_67_12]|nr:MAG: hypothetical protein A2Z64_12120 [Betaproteobacteria bacterium RIFCSPLOWO2_02_67_12]